MTCPLCLDSGVVRVPVVRDRETFQTFRDCKHAEEREVPACVSGGVKVEIVAKGKARR